MSASAQTKTSEAPKERRDPYQLVTNTIIKHLEEGVVPWRCPWNRQIGKPRNFHTGKPYRGINQMLLSLRRFASPFWVTFNQVKALGGSVRKGERGSTVVKYGSFQPKSETDVAADDAGKAKAKLFLKDYVVFNALQTEGISYPAVTEQGVMLEPKRIEVSEQMVASMPSKPSINEGRKAQASYNRVTDTIQMPALKRFESSEAYYLTLFHELIHATGHESRLNRQSLVEHDEFGGKVYSQEELVAEMGAAFLGLEADIVQDDHEQAAAYIQSWLDVLREPDHTRWLVKASNQAARAADFVLGIKQPVFADAPNS